MTSSFEHSFMNSLQCFLKKHYLLLVVIFFFAFFRGVALSWWPSLVYLITLSVWILLIHTTWFSQFKPFLKIIFSTLWLQLFFLFVFIVSLIQSFTFNNPSLDELILFLNQLPFVFFPYLLYAFLYTPDFTDDYQQWLFHFPSSYRFKSFYSFTSLTFSSYYVGCLFLIFLNANVFLQQFPSYSLGLGTFLLFILIVGGFSLNHPHRHPSHSFQDYLKTHRFWSLFLFLFVTLFFIVASFFIYYVIVSLLHVPPFSFSSFTNLGNTGRMPENKTLIFRVKTSQPLSSSLYLRENSFDAFKSREPSPDASDYFSVWYKLPSSEARNSDTYRKKKLEQLPHQDTYFFPFNALPRIPSIPAISVVQLTTPSQDASFSSFMPLDSKPIDWLSPASQTMTMVHDQPLFSETFIEFNRHLFFQNRLFLPLPHSLQSLSLPASHHHSLKLDFFNLPFLSEFSSSSLSYRATYSLNGSDPQTPPVDSDLDLNDDLRSALTQWLKEESLNLQGTPDDIAQGLRQHFLKHWTYTLDLPTPEGQPRGLMTFLTQDRRGHCEFYATAMTLLLRALGIPTRYTTGYLVNEYHPREDRYWVRQSNAHAWATYWNGQEWVVIDATPSIRSDRPDPDSPFQPFLDAMDEFFYNFNQWSLPSFPFSLPSISFSPLSSSPSFSFSNTPFSFLMGVSLFLVGFLLYRFARRNRSHDQALNRLLHFLSKQTGVQRDPLETSCDYLARLLPLLPSDCHELMNALILQRQAEIFLPHSAALDSPALSSGLLAQQLLVYFRQTSSFRVLFWKKKSLFFFSQTLN